MQEAAISSLGEIGGPSARAVLHQIAADSKDERVLEAVSEALAQADFGDDPMGIALGIERSIAEDQEDEADE